MTNLKISFDFNAEFIQDCESLDEFIKNIQDYCIKNWPSLKPIHAFIGDYELAILENKFCYIGFTDTQQDTIEVWLIIKTDQIKSKIAQTWFSKTINKFICLENNLV